jgi:hypothetical protein
MSYSEFRHWSVVHDREMIRISMQHQGEFFMLIPAYEGRRYRERRERALEMIQAAIDAGLEPGEVLPA